jgi:hypothetical protein
MSAFHARYAGHAQSPEVRTSKTSNQQSALDIRFQFGRISSPVVAAELD